MPVAVDRYELYCEEHGDHAGAAADAETGFVRRAARRFREQIAEAERESRRPASADASRPSYAAKVKTRSLRWIAQTIAEQRLLWNLRRASDARLLHPHDLNDGRARQLLRRSLTRDWERHRFWLAIYALFGAASLLLVVLPGPNVIGYYFLFRIVGHYFSMRGARQGLSVTAWTLEASEPLTALRSVVARASADRADVVGGVASSLKLEHLATFFERTAVS